MSKKASNPGPPKGVVKPTPPPAPPLPYILKEGKVKKGGVNEYPKNLDPPQEPPKGQGGKERNKC